MKLTRALGLQHFLEALDIKIGWYLPVDRSRTNQLVLVSLSNPLTYTSLPLSLCLSLSFCLYLYLFLCSQPPWYWLAPLGLTNTPGSRGLKLELKFQLLCCPLCLRIKEFPWGMVSWSPFPLDDSRLFTLALTRHCLRPIFLCTINIGRDAHHLPWRQS